MSPYPVTTQSPDDAQDDIERCWVLREPGRFLGELFTLLPCRPGVVVALVRHASTDQQLLAAAPVTWLPFTGDPDDEPAREEDASARSELVRRAATRLWGRRSMRHKPRDFTFVSVSIRPGRVVPGAQEASLRRAWWFSNHLLPPLDGEIVLVTEHGWRASFGDVVGRYPALDVG